MAFYLIGKLLDVLGTVFLGCEKINKSASWFTFHRLCSFSEHTELSVKVGLIFFNFFFAAKLFFYQHVFSIRDLFECLFLLCFWWLQGCCFFPKMCVIKSCYLVTSVLCSKLFFFIYFILWGKKELRLFYGTLHKEELKLLICFYFYKLFLFLNTKLLFFDQAPIKRFPITFFSKKVLN